MAQLTGHRRMIRLAGAMNAKAARLGRNGRVTPENLGYIFLDSKQQCHYCGIGITIMDCSFDHVLPFAAGGDNRIDNLVASCLTCQRQKARRLAHEFAEARAMVHICPIDGTRFKPRYADVKRGFGTYCSLKCAGKAGGLVRSAVQGLAS